MQDTKGFLINRVYAQMNRAARRKFAKNTKTKMIKGDNIPIKK